MKADEKKKALTNERECLVQILTPQLDPLTDQQVMGIYSLQQSSQQAEEALSQGLEQLQQSLADTVASDSLSDVSNVGNYMDQMSIALSKLANLEGFVRQVFFLLFIPSSFSGPCAMAQSLSFPF